MGLRLGRWSRWSALPMRGINVVVVAALFLAGCQSQGRYPEQCAARIPGWKKPSDGYGILAITNKVHLGSDGTIKWNGQPITSAQLAEYSAIVPEMNPVPFMILDIEPGTPCQFVIETRQLIDQKAKCRETPQWSACGEGPEPWARVGDVIGPDGEPSQPFYLEPNSPEIANETR
jgi:hypothetical protein